MSLVKLKNVKKIYQVGEVKVSALKDINLNINKGKFISFIGPSGSGKTTLLNLIGCLDKPTNGEIFINDVKVNQLGRKESAKFRGDNIGFIFQNFNLLPVLTVFENVEYPLIMVHSVPKTERKKRVLTLLEKVGMLDQKDKYPNQLSGGQKQRVAVARALVTNPKIVLADEPTANLDHKTAYRVIKTMHIMKNELGTTFIFATHDPKVVGEVETIYTLEDGLVVDKKIHNDRKGN
ncbi:MAG: ABC transporter ATP-binding protein [Candidatus Cloacimonadota bacterium]|nr:MAG: ABC transporter ATP-binding protein [Candidatus Cloacimonadota bacterium]